MKMQSAVGESETKWLAQEERTDTDSTLQSRCGIELDDHKSALLYGCILVLHASCEMPLMPPGLIKRSRSPSMTLSAVCELGCHHLKKR